MSHSKRNTSLAFFTSYERDQLKSTWGSQSARLTRDSFLPFGSCTICLQPALDPVACPGGPIADKSETPANPRKRKLDAFTDGRGQGEKRTCHVFCRECAVASLLAQKKEVRRVGRERERAVEEGAEREAVEDEEARVRAVRDFERVQMGMEAGEGGKKEEAPDTSREEAPAQRLLVAAGGDAETRGPQDAGTAADASADADPEEQGKRTFTLNEDDLIRIARADRSAARAALSSERSATAKARQLPSFWVPASTPTSTASPASAAPPKQQSLCPASTAATAHPLSLKTLVPVCFSEEAAGKTRACPACSKPLSNASGAVLAKPCGHVVCGACVEKFVLGGEADEVGNVAEVGCFVCGEGLAERVGGRKREKGGERVGRGLVEISSEGTGFAGGGKNLVKRAGTVFQC